MTDYLKGCRTDREKMRRIIDTLDVRALILEGVRALDDDVFFPAAQGQVPGNN
jgi:hypothetical protein